jgi:hypothetical protein
MFPGYSFLRITRASAACVVMILFLEACVYHSFSPVSCDANPVMLTLVSKTDTKCALQEGSIEVSATGGSGTYRFKIDGGTEVTESFFPGLAAGIHLITAIDDHDCSAALEVTVMNTDGMNLEYESTNSGCSGSNGTITVTPVDGVPPIDYKISSGSYQAGNTFSGLSAGQYQVTAKDATGCEATITTHVKSGISFSNSVKPIIETNCIKSGCHNGAQFPNFAVFQNIKENAARIKEQVITRNMPEDGTLTQAEINSIVCWVDDGAPNN